MNYRADKLMIDGHMDTHTQTHTHTHTHAGNDNTRRPKLASGKKLDLLCSEFQWLLSPPMTSFEMADEIPAL